MSAIKDYLNIVRAGIKNGDKIIESLVVASQVKNGTASEGAIAEILRRKEICANCPFNSKNAKRDRGYNSSIPFEHCTLCLCRIGADDSKEACLSCTCGINEWNKRNQDKPPMEVKWGPYTETKN